MALPHGPGHPASAAECRAAGREDLSELAALYRAFFAEDAIALPAGLEENIAAMLDDPRAAIWLLKAGGGPALGFSSATLTRGAEFGLSAEVEDLYILPAARGQGHSKRLLAAALAWCRARGAKVASVVVTPEAEAEQGLSRFYTAQGFADTGRRIYLCDLAAKPW